MWWVPYSCTVPRLRPPPRHRTTIRTLERRSIASCRGALAVLIGWPAAASCFSRWDRSSRSPVRPGSEETRAFDELNGRHFGGVSVPPQQSQRSRYFRQGSSGMLKLKRTDWRSLQWTGSDASEPIQLWLFEPLSQSKNRLSGKDLTQDFPTKSGP